MSQELPYAFELPKYVRNKKIGIYRNVKNWPHQPLFRFLKKHNISKDQWEVLARKGIVSVSKHRNRYYTELCPELIDWAMKDILLTF